VLNAAARVVSGTHKFDRGLTHLLHSELHWLDVPQQIHFLLQARWSGTRFQIFYVTLRFAKTLLGDL